MEIVNLKKQLSSAKDQKERFLIYRSLWSRTSNTEILTDFPMHLDIELAGICNLKCKSCYQNGYITGRLGLMDFDMYKGIIDQSLPEGLCSIKLQIRGESFLHPKLIECIQYAKHAGIMDIHITTNATLLTEKMARDIFDSGLDWIVFSVDDHHDDACDKSRHFKVYPQTTETNIRNFLRLRKRLDKTLPQVRIQGCVSKLDEQAIAAHKEHITEKFPGVNDIILGKIHDFSDSRDSYPDLHINYTPMVCRYLFQRLAIFWDGSVTTCCMDYNNRFKLGNVKSQAIKEIWLSGKMQKMRNIHLDGKRREMDICKHCHAYVKPKNETIPPVYYQLSMDAVT